MFAKNSYLCMKRAVTDGLHTDKRIIHTFMEVINLGNSNSILNNFMAQLRDKTVQKDRMRFRINLERIGGIFAYEISKRLSYTVNQVVTPLGIADVPVLDTPIVAAAILRAGLPLHKGILNFFEDAQNAFVAAYRKYDKGDSFHINIEYSSSPGLSGKTLILADTMLATGASLKIAYDRLCEDGDPVHTHLVCPVSSADAVEHLMKNMSKDVTLWVAAIDEELTSHSYIVPGLGDAGDLAFGEKI